MAEIAFTAAATSPSSAPRGPDSGIPLSCWMRNLESVVRPRCMVWDSLLLRVLGGRLEHAAAADAGSPDRGEVLGRELAVAVSEQPARLSQARAVKRVTHAPGVGEVR